MKKLHISAIVFLIAAELLLGGCAEHRSTNTSGENSNFSLGISEVNSSNSATDEDNSEMNSLNSTTSEENSEINSSSSSDHAENSVQSSVTSQVLTPLSFSDEDLELQEILSGLSSAGTVYSWFMKDFGFIGNTQMRKIRITDGRDLVEENSFYLIPESFRDGELAFPATYAEMESLIGRFFSKQATAIYMEQIYKGTVTGEENGVLEVKLDGEHENIFPVFLEADGRMYRVEGIGVNTLDIDLATARVTDKDDGIIKFTYLQSCYIPEYMTNAELKYEERYSDYAQNGYIVLEDDGWKYPYWGYGGFD